MRSISKALLIIAAVAGWSCAAEGMTVIDGVTLIDGTGASPRAGYSIVIDGERIRDILPASEAAKYHGAKIVDAHGLFALPGLIDSHVHMATAPDRPYAEAYLRRDVFSGITAVRDMAGDARLLADLSRDAKLGVVPSPDIYYAALMAGPAFFKDPRTIDSARGAVAGEVPWMRAVTPDTDMTIAVAEAHGTGATAIKIYADLPSDLVEKITGEAHRQHMLVWAHASVFPANPREVVDAGVDVVSHACLLGYQVSKPVPPAYHNRPPVDAAKLAGDNPEIDALLADMKRRGTILDATLYVYDVMWHVPHAQPPPYCTLDVAEKLAAQVHRAGIPISAGTDAPGDWKDAWPSLFSEMSLLVHHAGLTPMEAIEASARIGAVTIGQSADMGTLATGKLANLVLVAKNPLADIDDLKSVVMTVKRGRIYRRADYRPITSAEVKGEQ